MTIAIPKHLRSVEFTELTLVDLSDVDVDRTLAPPVGADRQAGTYGEGAAQTPITTITTGTSLRPTHALPGSTTSTAGRSSTVG